MKSSWIKTEDDHIYNLSLVRVMQIKKTNSGKYEICAWFDDVDSWTMEIFSTQSEAQAWIKDNIGV